MTDRITLALHAPEDFVREMTSFLSPETREHLLGTRPPPDSRMGDNPPEIEIPNIEFLIRLDCEVRLMWADAMIRRAQETAND